jgi:hypothetical protein
LYLKKVIPRKTNYSTEQNINRILNLKRLKTLVHYLCHLSNKNEHNLKLKLWFRLKTRKIILKEITSVLPKGLTSVWSNINLTLLFTKHKTKIRVKMIRISVFRVDRSGSEFTGKTKRIIRRNDPDPATIPTRKDQFFTEMTKTTQWKTKVSN